MNATPEITWLVIISLVTAALWMPHILYSFATRGIFPTMGNPSPDDPPLAAWADRSKRAHANAVDNLVVFAALVLSAAALGVSTPATVLAAQIYVLARLAHFIVYVLGIPVLRTVTFLIGFFACVTIALTILMGAG